MKTANNEFNEAGLSSAACTQPSAQRRGSACANLKDVKQSNVHQKSEIKNLKSEISPPLGMTLIELLIVITILTTLVAGVIPILSPNNDERKIQAASRSFQTFISMAKAKAARTGRPHGIALRESSPGSGMALEAFSLAVPPSFAGFSTASAVRIEQYTPSGGPRAAGSGSMFSYRAHFVLSDFPNGSGYDPDFLPPNFVRPGDSIKINGVMYRFINNNGGGALENGFFKSVSMLTIQRVGSADLTLALTSGNFTSPMRYQIFRQPATSSESPYQFPTGVGVDMQGSIATSTLGVPIAFPRFPSALSLWTQQLTEHDQINIMFSPSGAVDSVSLNGVVLSNAVRIALLLGRIENAGIDPTQQPWVVADPSDKTEVEEKQKIINWLNLDSRILSILVSNGRAVVNKIAFVDFSLAKTNGGDRDGDDILIKADADDQIDAAYEFAREMSTAN